VAVFSRRALLRGGIAAAWLVAAPNGVRLLIPATAGAPLIRYDAASPEGRAMLEIYAVAVARMMALPASNPLSWIFQWNLHAIRNDRDHAAELAASGPGIDPALAAVLWDTCEAHFDPRRTDFFLPWHRLFVWRIERIVRRLTGEARFTMPYWNYGDPASRALPPEFRRPGDPFWGALYRADRNPGVNDGEPIDKDGEASIDLAAMMSAAYRDTGSGDAGFSFNLDNAPHAAVHIDIGTRRRGMGAVAWSLNDPIFWLHHSSIDRIWASWNRAGGRNPPESGFLGETFAFIDEDGRLARSACADAMATASLGYGYDHYLERPPSSLPFSANPAFTEHAAARGTVPAIGPSAVPVSVTFEPGAADFAAGAGRIFVLRFGGVRIVRQPKVSYRIYLAPEPGMAAARDDPSHIGDINAFGVVPREGDAKPGPALATFPRAYSFVVTERIRRLLQAGRLAAPLQVILAPTGNPAADTEATIDEIVLLSS
jgi:tyrosinase